MHGYADVLIGLQFGDEGKARIIDHLAGSYDIIARFNGGPNAGHTICVGDKQIATHQIPSGIFHPGMKLYVGSGCVLSLTKMLTELHQIEELGVDLTGRLFISDAISVIQPSHVILDRLTGAQIGTTVNGIGPCYADRAIRSDGVNQTNLRLSDLDSPKEAANSMRGSYAALVRAHGATIPPDIEDAISDLLGAAEALRPFVCRDPLWLTLQVQGGANVLFEGAQSAMLDVVTGTVPYVTSSSTLAGAAFVGGDLAPRYHRKTFGVVKALMSRVGSGPFVSELGGALSEVHCTGGGAKLHTREWEENAYDPEEMLRDDDLFRVGIGLRMLSGEYGASTGRPRRLGALDLVMLANTCLRNGVDELFVNKVDALALYGRTSLPGIPLVSSYTVDGEQQTVMPTSLKEQLCAKPVLDYTPHISAVHLGSDVVLQQPAVQQLIGQIESATGAKIAGIGIGPEREQFVTIG